MGSIPSGVSSSREKPALQAAKKSIQCGRNASYVDALIGNAAKRQRGGQFYRTCGPTYEPRVDGLWIPICNSSATGRPKGKIRDLYFCTVRVATSIRLNLRGEPNDVHLANDHVESNDAGR